MLLTGLSIERVQLSDEGTSEILQTAIDAGHTHGFGYWGEALDARRDRDGRLYRLQIREREPIDKHHMKARGGWIGKAQLEAGIVEMLNDRRVQWPNDGIVDGPLADLIIQFAMFGEQVYG